MKKIYLLSIILFFTSYAQAGLYRWVDASGNVHFSDKVPSSASSQSHSKLNKSGDVKYKVNPKTKLEELKQIKNTKIKQKQIDTLNKINAEKRKEQQLRDSNLLSTYENQNELTSFFEKRMSMINGNNKILHAHNKILENKLIVLKKKSLSINNERHAKKIDQKIVNIKKTIEKYNLALKDNDQQLDTLAINYKETLARFIELNNQQQ